MLKQPDLQVLRSLHSLVRTPMWKQVELFLKVERTETLNRIVATTDMAQIHEARGRAKHITEFLQLCAQTQELLEKLEKSQN